ncbi:MAG: AmmeMemoRadiSam system radical SAM enzyme [bacterium]
MRVVEYYHPENDKLICDICPHHCALKLGETGICRGRRHLDGKLIAVNYAEVASLAVDPVEKKPLYHFHPGSLILSIGANGCNLQCRFCQNSELSQGEVPTRHVPVSELVRIAGTRGSMGVAFTYSEPLIWYEYVLDASQELRKKGYVSVLVTNGYVEEKPLQRLLPFVDAMNVDLKSPQQEFYRKLCKAELDPVQRSIRLAYEAGVHIEITHLIVTGWNDREEVIEELSQWIAALDPEIPLHLSRCFPHYRYHESATSAAFLTKAHHLARKHLRFVYLGNVASEVGADTQCPDCKALLVQRRGYHTQVLGLKGDSCAVCGRKLPFRVS